MKDATQTKADSEGSILAGYIAPTELCRQLGKTRRTIDRWHSRGLGPPRIRIERMVLYRIADVRAWLEAHLERREFRRGQAVGSAGVGGGK
jgi:predicted DNA-binding transcriptional regulator AlpA